jgi:two-component sensor histidine kinase
VTIALRRRSERAYRLAIRDDGVGIGPKRRNGSIGLKLIHALAEQIGGTVAIEADGGTLVAVTFAPDAQVGAH